MMDILKKFFPFAFAEKKDVAALVINIIIHVVAAFVIGVVLGLLAIIPIIGILISIAGAAIDLYILISLVLSILDYCKLLK